MRGHHVHEDVSCTLGIASRQIYKQLLRDGYLEMLVDAGVRVLELACGPCCAIGQTPPTNGVAVRTSNRNFRGRAGNPNADIYLVSPETAAATAVRGTFATAEEIMGEEVKILADVTEPEFYRIDDSMLIKPLPAEEAAKIEIKKGPNIRFLPVPEELSKDLRVPVSLKGGDNISTDDITPASQACARTFRLCRSTATCATMRISPSARRKWEDPSSLPEKTTVRAHPASTRRSILCISASSALWLRA